MASAAELAILIKSQGVDEASKSIGGLGEKLGGLGKIATIGMAAVGGAAIAAGAALFKVGSDFDEAFDTIRLGTGTTGAALEGLKGDMKAAFADVPADMKDVGTAIADLNTRLGLTGEPLQKMTKQFLELSRLTKTDVAANIRETTRVFGDWGISADKQAETLDMMFRATQVTGIGMSSLQQKVVQFGAPLRAMGFGLGESVAMLGKWEKEGVNTELVLGSLRIAMGQFANANIPMRQGLEETVKKIQALGPSAAATSLAMETFGARAGPDMAAAILEGRFAYEDLMKAIGEGKDTIIGVGKETSDFAEKFTILKNRAMLAIEPLASGLFNAVGGLMDKFDEWGPGISTVTGFLGDFAGAMKSAFSGETDFGAVTQVLKDAFGPEAQAAGEQLIGRFQDVADVLKSNLGPAWAEFSGNFASWWSEIQVLVGPALETIKAWIGAFLATIREWWDRHGKNVMAIVQGLFTILQGVFQVAFSIIGGLIKVFLSLLGGDFEGAGKALQEMWKGVWEGVQKIFGGAFEVLKNLLWTWISTMGEIGGRLGGALKDGILGRLKGIPGIEGLLGAIGMAQGGIVTRPTLAVLGERGPEAVIPLGRGGQGLAGANVTINMNGVSFRNRADIDYFAARTSAKVGAAVNRAMRFGPVAP